MPKINLASSGMRDNGGGGVYGKATSITGVSSVAPQRSTPIDISPINKVVGDVGNNVNKILNSVLDRKKQEIKIQDAEFSAMAVSENQRMTTLYADYKQDLGRAVDPGQIDEINKNFQSEFIKANGLPKEVQSKVAGNFKNILTKATLLGENQKDVIRINNSQKMYSNNLTNLSQIMLNDDGTFMDKKATLKQGRELIDEAVELYLYSKSDGDLRFKEFENELYKNSLDTRLNIGTMPQLSQTLDDINKGEFGKDKAMLGDYSKKINDRIDEIAEDSANYSVGTMATSEVINLPENQKLMKLEAAYVNKGFSKTGYENQKRLIRNGFPKKTSNENLFKMRALTEKVNNKTISKTEAMLTLGELELSKDDVKLFNATITGAYNPNSLINKSITKRFNRYIDEKLPRDDEDEINDNDRVKAQVQQFLVDNIDTMNAREIDEYVKEWAEKDWSGTLLDIDYNKRLGIVRPKPKKESYWDFIAHMPSYMSSGFTGSKK